MYLDNLLGYIYPTLLIACLHTYVYYILYKTKDYIQTIPVIECKMTGDLPNIKITDEILDNGLIHYIFNKIESNKNYEFINLDISFIASIINI